MTQPNWGARLLWAFLGLLTITGASGVAAVAIDNFPHSEKILATTGALSGYCLLALLCWFLSKTHRARLSIRLASVPLAASLVVVLLFR